MPSYLRFNTDQATIVVPTYEKHYNHFYNFIASIDEHCLDKECLSIIVVIEKSNFHTFLKIKEHFQSLKIDFVFTEDILINFGLTPTPSDALKKIGKFTFQSLKKFGGLLKSETKWSIVLDSETLFHTAFSVKTLVSDYEEKKYIFYTKTINRGHEWQGSLVANVTEQCSSILNYDGRSRCYMELIIWFFETEKVISLFEYAKKRIRKFLSHASENKPIFENILYYMFLEIKNSTEYNFIDISEAWRELVPSEISGRYDLGAVPFSFVGADHISYMLRPSEIASIEKFITHYKIPFFRAEPALLNTLQYQELKRLPYLKAFVSSCHIPWLRKRIAICISGEFRDQPMVFSKIRHLVGFLTGCDCDIYLHGWRNPNEAVIIENLKPKAYCFEEPPVDEINDYSNNIIYKELNLKPERDQHSLLMFYGLQKVFDLVEKSNVDYDFVIRLRPDIYCDLTLLEILRHISLEGDPALDSVFVPRHYHSQGLNDQIACGGINAMRTYMSTFSFIKENIKELYFNPESLLLKNLLENDVHIFLFDCRYALMRAEPYHVENIARILSLQDSIWWSSCENIPAFQKCNGFLKDKIKCVEFLKKRPLHISDIFVSINISPGDTPPNILSISWRDGNPNGKIRMLTSTNNKEQVIVHPIEQFFTIQKGKFVPSEEFNRSIFCYLESDVLYIVEWKYEGTKFVRNLIYVDKEYTQANYIRN